MGLHWNQVSHLWFDGAVDGWGAGGLHAPAAEGLGAGREGGVGDAVGHFVLQRWGALSVQLRSLLHLKRKLGWVGFPDAITPNMSRSRLIVVHCGS